MIRNLQALLVTDVKTSFDIEVNFPYRIPHQVPPLISEITHNRKSEPFGLGEVN